MSNLLGPLTTLMNEAVGVRIQVVLAGLPRVVTNRLGMNIERRFVFQLADPNEYADRRCQQDARAATRRAAAGDRRPVEARSSSSPSSPHRAAPRAPVIQQLAERLPAATRRPPRPFADVSWPQPWEQAPLDRLTPPAHLVSPLPVAVDTQTGEWAWIDAVDDGPVFAVAGPPKSGRSTAMATMARLASRVGLVGAQRHGCRGGRRWRRGTTRRSAARSRRRPRRRARGARRQRARAARRPAAADVVRPAGGGARPPRPGPARGQRPARLPRQPAGDAAHASRSPVPGCCWRRPARSTAAPSACAG